MTEEQVKSFKSKMQYVCDSAVDVLDTIETHKIFAKKQHKSIESVINEESVRYFWEKVKEMHDKCSMAQWQLESIIKLMEAKN